MDDKKLVQAERVIPPSGTRRTLRSATATQASSKDIAAPEQKKSQQKAMLAAQRALLDKEGFLKTEEDLTATSLYTAYKLIFDRYLAKTPSDTQKVMLAFKAALAMYAAEKNSESETVAETCAKRISDKVDEALDRGITKLSNAIESTLTAQREIQSASLRVEETATAIHKALEDVGKNLTTISDTSNKLTNTVSSYKEILLTAPKPPQQDPADNARSLPDPKITRDLDRKAAQVLVDIYNKEVVNRSLEELKSTFNALIAEEPTEPLTDVDVQHITKLRNGGLILQFGSKEAAEWFRQPVITKNLLPKIDSSATLKARNFQILVPRVPVIFEPDNEASICELEEQNSMSEGSLPKARWIKPIYRRTLGQHSAHLALSVSTPEDANTLIRDSIYICGIKTYPRKLKTEPKQCMKCRKWGHFAADCLEEKDACSNCGENHHTKNCPDKSRRYCVSCKNDTHASWDRGCPEFKRRVDRMDENHPENALTYFPTDEDWTKHAHPARIDIDTKFPAKYLVASLPPPAMDLRQPPTRQVKSKKRGPKLVQLNGKGPIDDFLMSISSKSRKMEGRQSDDELFDPLSDDEITCQLDNAFTEE
jgi:hypothetical protein